MVMSLFAICRALSCPISWGKLKLCYICTFHKPLLHRGSSCLRPDVYMNSPCRGLWFPSREDQDNENK